jgi:octaprenyl-diphosphate synthase
MDLTQAIHDIQRLIEQRLKSPLALQQSMHDHWLNRQGKCIRAQLVLAASHCLGYQGAQALQLGAIIELLHAATLLHDDVIDHASERRTQKASHQIFGNHAAILGGDYLYAVAFTMITELKDHAMNAILAEATAAIVSGELRQLQHQDQDRPSTHQAFRVIKGKTARLFATACHLGGLASGKPREAVLLSQFGHCFGMSYQLIDDALDYLINPMLGKAHGNDLREGKPTIPLLLTMTQEPAYQKLLLQALYGDHAVFDAALAKVAEHGVMPTLALAKRYLARGTAYLSSFDKNQTELLMILSEKLRTRIHKAEALILNPTQA